MMNPQTIEHIRNSVKMNRNYFIYHLSKPLCNFIILLFMMATATTTAECVDEIGVDLIWMYK